MASRPYLRRPAESSRRLAVWAFAFWFCFLAAGSAAAPAPAGPQEVSGGPEPIVVTAGTLLADNKKSIVVYKTNVVVKRGAVTLYADEVTVRLSGRREKDGAKEPGEGDFFSGPGNVETIEARGGVKIVQDDKTATADEAVYYAGKDTITLTGSPRMWQGPNVLTGSSITFNVVDDTIMVEDARTILYQEKGGPMDDGADEAP